MVIFEQREILWGKQSIEIRLLHGFHVARCLIGPGIDIGYFDSAIIVDKYVFRFDVSQLDAVTSDVLLAGGKGVEHVPQF